MFRPELPLALIPIANVRGGATRNAIHQMRTFFNTRLPLVENGGRLGISGPRVGRTRNHLEAPEIAIHDVASVIQRRRAVNGGLSA